MFTQRLDSPTWLLGAVILAAGCSAQDVRDRHASTGDIYKMPDAEQIADDLSEDSMQRQDALHAKLEQQAPAPQPLAPVVPKFNPLDEVLVNLVVEDAELQHILKALAKEAGLNLLIHPNLIGAPYRLSVDFRGVSATKVFEQICKLADVHGHFDGNTIVVDPLQERMFQLGFMESDVRNNFAAGGDVLGSANRGGNAGGGNSGGGGGGGNQMRGNFNMQGSLAPSSNPYDQLEDMLETLIGHGSQQTASGRIRGADSLQDIGEVARIATAMRSDQPLYSLNRMTGTLFVRAKPSVMGAVTRLIDTYEKILAGQILIDAQLIEVRLSDAFKWGIDWTQLRNQIATSFTAGPVNVSEATGTFGGLTQGTRSIVVGSTQLAPPTGPSLGYNMVGNRFALAANIMQQYGDVSVLSNPTIRSKHGQAAVISVGTSSTYVSNTKVTTNGSATTAITNQEVQTSTVFDGILIGVVPFVDTEGNITLSVHPVQSKVDPGSLALVDTGNETRITLPRVELKSLVTQVKCRSGDAVILGGLIDQADLRTSQEIPGMGRIPLLGNLFRQRENSSSLRELVLVMKVTIL